MEQVTVRIYQMIHRVVLALKMVVEDKQHVTRLTTTVLDVCPRLTAVAGESQTE
jgi:hypothetical protein